MLMEAVYSASQSTIRRIGLIESGFFVIMCDCARVAYVELLLSSGVLRYVCLIVILDANLRVMARIAMQLL